MLAYFHMLFLYEPCTPLKIIAVSQSLRDLFERILQIDIIKFQKCKSSFDGCSSDQAVQAVAYRAPPYLGGPVAVKILE